MPNNPNAPEQSQVIGELQRLSVSGDWVVVPLRLPVEAQPRVHRLVVKVKGLKECC